MNGAAGVEGALGCDMPDNAELLALRALEAACAASATDDPTCAPASPPCTPATTSVWVPAPPEDDE